MIAPVRLQSSRTPWRDIEIFENSVCNLVVDPSIMLFLKRYWIREIAIRPLLVDLLITEAGALSDLHTAQVVVEID